LKIKLIHNLPILLIIMIISALIISAPFYASCQKTEEIQPANPPETCVLPGGNEDMDTTTSGAFPIGEIPPIDISVPVKTETATFALG